MRVAAARKDCLFPASEGENADGKEINRILCCPRHRRRGKTATVIQYIVVAATTREISLRICVRFGVDQGSFFFPFVCISFFCFMVVSFGKDTALPPTLPVYKFYSFPRGMSR